MSADFPRPDTRYRFHVSYGETDCMGVAYYGEYLHWFERARSQLIRERGLSYAEVEARGLYLPVREASVRYRRPARYEQELFVRVGVSEWGRASVTFAYEVWGPPEGTVLIATGATQHACTSLQGKPVPTPEWLKDLFRAP